MEEKNLSQKKDNSSEKNRRTIITGDIHGCFDEYEQLLKIVNLNTDDDRLIILGDLFDRGPNSYEVLKKTLELKEKMGERFTWIIGNHEDMLLNAEHDYMTWAINGNRPTLKSFEEHDDSPLNYIEIYKSLPTYYKGDGFICVHAGVDETGEIPVEETGRDTLIWDRRCARLGYYNGPLVIAGHTPLKMPILWQDEEHQVLNYDTQYDLPDYGFMCIDTACVYGIALTALVIMDGKMILRKVDSKRQPPTT